MATRSRGARHYTPLGERPPAEQAVVMGVQQVTADAEQVQDDSLNHREGLQLSD